MLVTIEVELGNLKGKRVGLVLKAAANADWPVLAWRTDSPRRTTHGWHRNAMAIPWFVAVISLNH